MIRPPQARRKRHESLLGDEDHDPMSGVANLFDVAMIFAVSLLMALFARSPASELLARRDSSASGATSQPPEKDSIPKTGDRLEHFQVGDREAGGKGERLGIAYRLPSGEVIYVPESPKAGSQTRP